MTNAPPSCSAYVERIDSTQANAKKVWQEMGEPEYLKAHEVERLQEASRVWKKPHHWEYEERAINLNITLPPHAVAAITLEFAPGQFKGGISA